MTEHHLTDAERQEIHDLIQSQPLEKVSYLAQLYLQAWSRKDEGPVKIELHRVKRQLEKHGKESTR